MPVLNCDASVLEGVNSIVIAGIRHQLEISGRNPGEENLSLLNIYTGMRIIKIKYRNPWYICVEREYGYLAVLFHMVERHKFVIDDGIFADSKGLCITFVWTSAAPNVNEVHDAVETADNIVRDLEMLSGSPLPIPLKLIQLPDQFEVAIMDAGNEYAIHKKQAFHHSDDFGKEIHEGVMINAGALRGAYGPIDQYFPTLWAKAMHQSALWQRKAIRALGMEEWSEAIVCSNTFIETLMVNMAVCLNKENGTPIIDLVGALTVKGGLPAFVCKHLGNPFLKGRWDVSYSDTPFGNWHKNCFSMRHRVVHAGHFASMEEAEAAYNSANRLAHDITERSKSMSKKLKKCLEPMTLMPSRKAGGVGGPPQST